MGVARQHAGITGQVENCQTVVFVAYVTARAHALFDFRLYLPKAWCADRERREQAHVPDGRGVHHQARPGRRDDHRRGRRGRAVRLGGRRRGVRPQLASCAKPARRPGRGTCSRSR